MDHPEPTTTSLEDLPPPYLDYFDAAALCRLGYGTTKKQHFGVTSAAVRGWHRSNLQGSADTAVSIRACTSTVPQYRYASDKGTRRSEPSPHR